MIWTIYNHGTGGSQWKDSEKGEIVNLFGANDNSLQRRGKIITEGVGSIGDPHQMTGANPTASMLPGAPPMPGPKSSKSRSVAGITGDGVQQNVNSTIDFLRALYASGHPPTRINMLGWSRGAVTCIRLAYQLSMETGLCNIPVNIFAVDPVAGAGHSTEVDACTITSNVQNYVATLATGEARRAFKPIAGDRLRVQDQTRTNMCVLPMPGHHSDTAKNDNYVGKLVFNLAYRFLYGLGSPVDRMIHYTLRDAAAWALYEGLMLDPRLAHKTSKFGILTMGLVPYNRVDEAAAHNFGEDFFPNLHARKLMEVVFPLTYNFYFRQYTAGAEKRMLVEQRVKRMSQAMIDKLDAYTPSSGATVNANNPFDRMFRLLQMTG